LYAVLRHAGVLVLSDGTGQLVPFISPHITIYTFLDNSCPAKEKTMSVAVITGSNGLIGAEAASYFSNLGMHVVGIDNDMRSYFFGPESSTSWKIQHLRETLGKRYEHHELDVRNRAAMCRLFQRFGSEVDLVIHTAAQPSHDWAAREPFTDFDVNAGGTLSVLEAVRQNCPDAVFIFTSTNKVYGDAPNSLPIVEHATRFELPANHSYYCGIKEDMSIDSCLHSVFGASKVAADVMVQEYGRYFGMYTGCFRGGTLTGPGHAAAELHGFLAYLMKCAMTGTHYKVFGYKGKQVRDVIHSHDLITAFHEFYRNPRVAEIYNIGGGRFSNCSVLEALDLAQQITGRDMSWSYVDQNRIGDHIWWIGSLAKFQSHYPEWKMEYNVPKIAVEIHAQNQERWKAC
jgi:CDP-paratose 2-epimerase